LVYARVSLAHKDMEPELECFDVQTRKAEGFGELKSGFQGSCSLRIARECVTCTQGHMKVSPSNVKGQVTRSRPFSPPPSRLAIPAGGSCRR
jgi:hypothetical protein